MKNLPLFLILLASAALGREWTSTEGKKMEADFVSATGTTVTLKRADNGKNTTLPIARLSAEDQAFIKEQAGKPAAPAGTPGAAPAAAGAPKAVSGPFAELMKGDWALSEYKGLPFAIYGAKDLDASKAYPLVVSLHGKSGNNENGKQVAGWMKVFTKEDHYKKNPCIVVAPLCYQPYGGTGGGWSDKPGTEAIALIKALMKSLPIDKERVYCIGHSMGGFGTCHLIQTEPRLFAAGIPVSGCSTASSASTFRRVPLWIFHAADDDVVKVACSRDLGKALERVKECHYTEYETGGHGIPGKVFDDQATHDWLFAQGVKKP